MAPRSGGSSYDDDETGFVWVYVVVEEEAAQDNTGDQPVQTEQEVSPAQPAAEEGGEEAAAS